LGGNGIVTDYNVAKVCPLTLPADMCGADAAGQAATPRIGCEGGAAVCNAFMFTQLAALLCAAGGLQAFCDVEAFYTYEGTYDVNVLVAGRGITGIPAIKASAKPKSSAKKTRMPDVQA
jgi:hypothetical protein